MKLFHFLILLGAPLSLFFGTVAAATITGNMGRTQGFEILLIFGLFSLSFLMLVSGITSMLSYKIESNSAQAQEK